MKTSNKFRLMALLLAMSTTFSACANSNAENKQASSKKSAQEKTQAEQKIAKANSPLQVELNKAKAAGKAVFVVVTGTGATDVEKATSIAKTAVSINKNAIILKLDRDLPANADLVSKWGLSGAPLPLILTVSAKGYPTGGYILADATAEKVAALVPSPKLDDVYAALNAKKPVFLVVSKRSNIDKTAILSSCKSASVKLSGNVAIVEIDLADPKEAAFIKNLNLQNPTNTTTVMVLNTSGQATGVFKGKVEATELVSAATKVVSGGCGTSCAPGGC